MSRLPYAAQTLLEQVKAEKSRASMKEVSDPDGLRVVRVVRFDKTTSKWLQPILEAMDDDRIVDAWNKGGYLHVTFSPGPNADDRRPFPLEEAGRLAE